MLLILANCTGYTAKPLDTTPHLARSLAELQQQSATTVDATKPLTMADVVKLMVQYNPDLHAARFDHEISQGQIIEAAVLPNPQFSGNYGYLMSGDATYNAYSFGLTEDIKALIIRGAQRASADYNSQKVDADLLWQEWQLIGKARLLFVDLVQQQKLQAVLAYNQAVLLARDIHNQAALAAGNVDLTTVAPDQAALADNQKNLADLNMQITTKWQALDALLGLLPDVRFALDPNITISDINVAKVEAALPELLLQRPDLQALQLGYQSQEEKLWGAVLAQFPALLFGGNYGQDTSRIATGGPLISLDLPIFNRNQGNIAIETATREKLHTEYHNHLNAAFGEVKAMLAQRGMLQANLAQIQPQSVRAAQIAVQAQHALRDGNIDERSYVDLQISAASQQQQAINYTQALLEQEIALATLLGTDMPQIQVAAVKDKP